MSMCVCLYGVKMFACVDGKGKSSKRLGKIYKMSLVPHSYFNMSPSHKVSLIR